MSKPKGGRMKGMTKEITDARKVLRRDDELAAMVSDDVIEAYEVVRGVMKDTSAPAASRRAAANDVLNMFSKVHARSAEVLKDFYGENGEDVPDEVEKASNVKPIFDYQS